MQAALSQAQRDQDQDLSRSGDPRVKGHSSYSRGEVERRLDGSHFGLF